MTFGARIHTESRDIYSSNELHIPMHYIDFLNGIVGNVGWPNNTFKYKSHNANEDRFVIEIEAPADLKEWIEKLKGSAVTRIDSKKLVFCLTVPFQDEQPKNRVKTPQPKIDTHQKITKLNLQELGSI